MQPSRELRLLRALALLLCLVWATVASAQTRVPELRPAPDTSALMGRVLTRVVVAVDGARWRGAPPSVRAVAGQVLSSELVRRSLDELLETGRFADARAEVEADGEGVRL